MDTPQDFRFLIESIAQRHNPYYENEYLVIQTYPREIQLRVETRRFDYAQAKKWCELENFAHDYTSFALKIFHQGKLYSVNSDGTPGEISRQQDWKIDPRYLNAHYDQNSEAEIIVCNCSYPYFLCFLDPEDSERQPVTCLVDDFGGIINNCPNCGIQIVDDIEIEDEPLYFEEEQEYIPEACQGCSNYHGSVYNGNLLVCAIHPYGWNNQSCPDFTR